MSLWMRIAMVVLVLAATAGPVAYAVHLEREQAAQQDAERARRLAAEVLARVEGSGRAVMDAFARIEAAGFAPCSDAEHKLMRSIELGSGYIRALGRVQGSRLVCSPLGAGDDAPELGPLTPSGDGPVQLRADVRFPGVADMGFLVVERHGMAAVVTKELPFDLTDWRRGEVLATLGSGGAVYAQRGTLQPAWVKLARATHHARVVVERDHVVAVQRSPHLSVVAIAALPRSSTAIAANRAAARALPIGIVAGLALLLVAARLSRSLREMPTLLRAALRNGELRLAYQPIVDMDSGRTVGVEALLRWPRAHGAVAPDVFVRVAEESGLVTELTAHLFDLLRRDLPPAFLIRHPGLALALNLSADDLYAPATLAHVKRLQAHVGSVPGVLKVELTERSTTRMEQARPVMDGLRELGVRVAIDDFGTGYSNLATLQRGQFDEIKIDKAFIEAIGSGAANSGVVDHVIAMARALRCEVVAEGVETPAQAAYLRERGVRHAQGFLYARPMAYRELEAHLAADARRARPQQAAMTA